MPEYTPINPLKRGGLIPVLVQIPDKTGRLYAIGGPLSILSLSALSRVVRVKTPCLKTKNILMKTSLLSKQYP
jgi:hypothetical protein